MYRWTKSLLCWGQGRGVGNEGGAEPGKGSPRQSTPSPGWLSSLTPALQPEPPEAAPRAGLSQAGTWPQGAASSPHCLLEWTVLPSTQGQNTQDRAGKSGGQGGRSRAPERQEFKTFAHLLQEGKKGLSRQQAQRHSSEVAAVQVSNFKERKRWPGFLTLFLYPRARPTSGFHVGK